MRSNRHARATRAIFLDKDGTLVEDVPYSADPEQLRFTEGATSALRLWADAGYDLIVISNQSGVARGYFPESALAAVEERLREMVEGCGARLRAFYFCPHFAAGTVPAYSRICQCRKPEPGLILQASEEHGIELAHSWMVGDRREDVEAGRRAGCRTAWIRKAAVTEPAQEADADLVCPDLLTAAQEILRRDARIRR